MISSVHLWLGKGRLLRMKKVNDGVSQEEKDKNRFLEYMEGNNLNEEDVEIEEETSEEKGEEWSDEDSGDIGVGRYYHTDDRNSSGMYLDALRLANVPLLSREEEYELGIRIQNGDLEARNILVERNLRLVISIGKKFINQGLPFEDIVQEGNIGLMRAAKSFDPNMGYKFSTYATWWIRQAMQRAVMNDSNTVRIPVHMLENVKKVGKYISNYQKCYSEEPSESEIEAYMRENHMDVSLMNSVRTMTNLTSIDSLLRVDGDSDTTLGEILADTSKNIEDDVVMGRSNAALMKIVRECCNDREYYVLAERFGIYSGSPKTLEEVGQQMGVTRERVRQIESKALRKLRGPRRMRALKELRGGIC